MERLGKATINPGITIMQEKQCKETNIWHDLGHYIMTMSGNARFESTSVYVPDKWFSFRIYCLQASAFLNRKVDECGERNSQARTYAGGDTVASYMFSPKYPQQNLWQLWYFPFFIWVWILLVFLSWIGIYQETHSMMFVSLLIGFAKAYTRTQHFSSRSLL